MAMPFRVMLTHLTASFIGSPAVHEATTASKASPTCGLSMSMSFLPPPGLRMLVVGCTEVEKPSSALSLIPLLTVFLEISKSLDILVIPPWGSADARVPAYNRR